MNHKEKRKQFYQQIPHYWADLYGQEYSLYDMYLVTEQEASIIRKTTNRVGHLFFKTAELMRQLDDDLLLSLGFPASSLRFLRIHRINVESVIARLDLVQVEKRYVVLEINSDTPTFLKELFFVNDRICKEFGYKNPNEGEEKRLKRAVQAAILMSLEGMVPSHVDTPHIVFTSHADNPEDRYTAEYLRELAALPSLYVPLHELQIVEGKGLYDADGQRIDLLYRQTYPIEQMLADYDPITKEPVGEMLLELVALRKLAILNPISAFLLQSKAIQAVIWGLHEEQHPFYSTEEHAWIAEHFLPTYLEPDLFREQGVAYVQKPAFGREGDTVQIIKDDAILHEDSNKSYADFLSVYQKHVPLPTTYVQTVEKIVKGHIMVGSFLINGQASAFGYRLGGPITDNMAYFLPCGYK
ncbi:glutathionylspermidine synthase family protein [Brevibacillus laterosporus]|uniref:glutathionylspermidine synthase family protein n=1 Tax=Brevibacillus laterosporus TaxID=1465 RepID=UPI00264C3EFE|nr:glutathionylspermidine synthase family protein [Brevibacillus laterosporus]MDN9009011.1 glutathionylspermidine synthase family protein [Brevibacillus laterosporus]MDO0943592.1 glutathionylspermidine synthase family protein [Brevibacillus laterosporus]